MESSNARPLNLGYLFVVGGFGGSGATTIAQMLAREFKLNRIYAGGLMRDSAKSKGFDKVEDFLNSISEEELEKYDRELDKKMIRFSYLPNTLIDSKIFAVLATKYRLPTTVKIWLDCDIEVRAKRKSEKEKIPYEVALADLSARFEKDKIRFERMYNIDYSSPKKYNDIVINSSKLNEYQTLKIILDSINDGGYIK